MMKINKKIKFMKFIFISIIFIVVMVYGYNTISTSIVDSIGNKIFSEIANQYSAEYIFDDNYKENGKVKKIEELGGWIFKLNDDFSLKYISSKNVPQNYKFEDIVDLNKGTYLYNDKKYFGSVKKITKNDGNQYGIVVVPSKYISNKVLLTPQNQNLGYFVMFFIIRSIIFILGAVIVVFIFSKILYRKLYKPLNELEKGFEKLKEENYINALDPVGKTDIVEFSDINKSFNSMVIALDDLQKERLKNREKRIRLFVDIRHDLKTPITVIKGFSEALISKKIPEKDTQKYLESINNNAISINNLLNELSEIIEYENYSYILQPKTVDFCEYLRQTIITFLPIFEQKNMEISINMPDDKILLDIDINIFTRALNNLMKNIVDHNEKNVKVYFEVESNEEKVVLTIGDSGKIIDDDIVDKIFDPFVTSDNSRNASVKNRGLGLSITKNIIELHKGKIFLIQDIRGEITKKFIIELRK